MSATAPLNSTIESLNAELRAADPRLVANDDFLRGVLAGCGDCIEILDLDGRLQFISEAGKRVMEVDDVGKFSGHVWLDFWSGDGRLAAERAVEAAKAGDIGRFKGRAPTAKGNQRYWDVQVSAIHDSTGKPSHLLCILRDLTEEWRFTTELKTAIERQALLATELHHRIKNTLAMVAAIANQTIRGDDIMAAREAFTARVLTLSHAHDILTQTSWAKAPIRKVMDGALAPHRSGQGRIIASGPDFELQPRQALALSLAIHELATNAAKYGALSGEGQVNVAWGAKSIDDVPSFHLTWTESGGPPVIEPEPQRKGFGSRLIEKMLANEFKGTVRTFYRPDGVVCELITPLSELDDGGTNNS